MAVLDVFKDKLVKRGVSLKTLDPAEPKLSGKEYRMAVALKEGISQDNARKLSKIIRDEGPKGVRAQIQGEELRVSGKKKDDLQAVMALLKGKEFDFALQFTNYREPLRAGRGRRSGKRAVSGGSRLGLPGGGGARRRAAGWRTAGRTPRGGTGWRSSGGPPRSAGRPGPGAAPPRVARSCAGRWPGPPGHRPAEGPPRRPGIRARGSPTAG